jgi:ferredoxin/flavodoxin
MENKTIDLYYFSGTGNTYLACETFVEEVKNYGFAVNLICMEKADPAKINKNNILGLAFPVAMCFSYPFVFDFIRALPKVNGTKVFMFATMGGSAWGMEAKLKKILSAKGFNPVASATAIMPSNIFVIADEEKNKIIRAKGLREIRDFASAFAMGDAVWKSGGLLSLCSYMFYRAATATWKVGWMQRLFNNKLKADTCTKCGRCAALCPVGNITYKNGLPEFGVKCQYCMRCVSYCPTGAIKSRFIFKGDAYKAFHRPFHKGNNGIKI